MYAHTSSDKARFQPKISAAGFVCSAVFWYSLDNRFIIGFDNEVRYVAVS